MNKVLVTFIIIAVVLILLFIYSACILSNWCRKEEEKYRKNKYE